MNGLSTNAQTLQNLWGGFMSSLNLCRHFSFIQANSYSTNAAGYKHAAIPNWSCGDKSVSSQSAVRSRYAWMFEHYQVSTVLLEITVNQRDKGIIDELKADNGLSKGSLLILKRLMSLLRVANLKTRGITTTPSLYHNAERLFT